MTKSIIRIFFVSSAFLLVLTAAAKLVSSAGGAPILEQQEIIFRMSYRHLFWIVAGCELLVATACFLAKRPGLPAVLLACLSTYFLVYRICIHRLGFHYCSCLGSLTESLPFSKHTINLALFLVLLYFLCGSYFVLFDLWVRDEKPLSGGAALDTLAEKRLVAKSP